MLAFVWLLTARLSVHAPTRCMRDRPILLGFQVSRWPPRAAFQEPCGRCFSTEPGPPFPCVLRPIISIKGFKIKTSTQLLCRRSFSKDADSTPFSGAAVFLGCASSVFFCFCVQDSPSYLFSVPLSSLTLSRVSYDTTPGLRKKNVRARS